MKNLFQLLSFNSLFILSIVSCSCTNDTEDAVTPEIATGSISAKFNGTEWSGAWVTGLNANLGGVKVLTITGLKSEQDKSVSVAISISSFSGVGTYSFDGNSGNGKITIGYSGKNYISSPLAGGGGGGSGTIKITEYVAPTNGLNSGKAIGEFSGTIKSYNTNEQITVTSGKFTAIIVL